MQEGASNQGSGGCLSASAEQLVIATRELLSERATVSVSFGEISSRSGLNSALIKYYFKNKEGLLLAVLESDARAAMGAFSELVHMNIPAQEKLRIHIEGIINAYFRSPYLNRLIHFIVERGSEASGQKVVKLFIEPMLDGYRRIINQGVKEGTFRSVESAFLYYSLAGAADHIFHATYSVSTALSESRITPSVKRRYVEHVTELYLRGLKP